MRIRYTNLVSLGVLAAVGLVSCGGDDEPDMLALCEDARQSKVAEWEADLPADWLEEDSSFHWESAQKPLTEVTDQFTYDTGVISASGETDGTPWFCLYDPDEPLTGDAQWSWDE